MMLVRMQSPARCLAHKQGAICQRCDRRSDQRPQGNPRWRL